jgi:aerobic carbon-monoxide dehydrogenase large subunit
MTNEFTNHERGSPARPGKGRIRIGDRVLRKEDERFLRGSGTYSDDITKPGQCYAAFVRSPVPHGTLRRIDTDAAIKSDGVMAVLTGGDYIADGYGPVVHRAIEGDPIDFRTPAFGGDDPVALQFNQWPLPSEKVNHLGEPLAIVIAETIMAAEDAAERVVLDIDPLPAVITVDQATVAGAPLVNDDASANTTKRTRHS